MYNYLAWDPGVKIKEVRIAPITTGTQPISGGYLLRAGTPLSNAYAVKNDGNAKYLVAEDYIFYMADPCRNRDPVRLIEAGYVDLVKAQEASGMTYASSAKTALKNAGIFLLSGDEANVSSGTYTLPAATASKLGGIKVGEGLEITSGGVLSATGGGVLVASMDPQTMALDKTWQEIADAGFAVISASEGGGTVFATINSIGGGDGNYHVVFVSGTTQLTFLASSADGYPVMNSGGGGDDGDTT